LLELVKNGSVVALAIYDNLINFSWIARDHTEFF